jgi:hypothetical protein
MANLEHAKWLVEHGAANSLPAAYRLCREVLPAGVVVSLGPKKIRIDPEAFARWAAAGGSAARPAVPEPEQPLAAV